MMIPKEKKWYALYTKSRMEKKAEAELRNNHIEVYLPLQKVLKQWSDRKKWVKEPVIRSYIFVRINHEEYYEVLKSYGIVNFVTFLGKPVPIPEKQINSLKLLIDNDIYIDLTNEHFEKGEEVVVEYGKLKGLVGTLVEFRGKHKVLLEIKGLDQTLIANIPTIQLKKVPNQSVN